MKWTVVYCRIQLKIREFRTSTTNESRTFCFRGLVLFARMPPRTKHPTNTHQEKKYFIQYKEIWENLLLGGWCLSEFNDQLAYVSSYPLLLFQCCGTGMEFTVRELTHKAN